MDLNQPEITPTNLQTPLTPPQPVMARPILPIIIVSLMAGAVMMAAGIFGYQSLQVRPVSDLENAINVSTSPMLSTDEDTDTNSQTYTNSVFAFSFNSASPVKEEKLFNDESNRIITLLGDGLQMKVMLRKNNDPNFDLNTYYYMDQVPTSKTILSGQPANVHIKTGNACYGHGDNCPPYVAVVTLHNQDIWHLIFENTTEIGSAEEAVIQSFVFTD